MKKGKKILLGAAILIAAAITAFAVKRMPRVDKSIDKTKWNTNYTYVFVHGLSGWGSYDARYKILPYWGLLRGDLLKYLNKQGFDCYAASVNPETSAWDRACELYAQLTGTRVDYGEAHAKAMGHDRYGEDFTGRALIPSFSAEDKINLVGHSFGGATIRLFGELMANGCEEEVTASGDDVSDLFKGGKEDWIYSMTTLAAPTNGTTAYYLGSGEQEKDEDAADTSPSKDKEKNTRSPDDLAGHDMLIDNALLLNEKIEVLPGVYYFSIPCCSTVENGDGTYSVDKKITAKNMHGSGDAMGKLTMTTPGGFVVDEKWLPNDGLVNTYSAIAPINAPQKQLDRSNIEKGIYQIFPTFRGDHMSIIGGLFIKSDVRGTYTDLMCLINEAD